MELVPGPAASLRVEPAHAGEPAIVIACSALGEGSNFRMGEHQKLARLQLLEGP